MPTKKAKPKAVARAFATRSAAEAALRDLRAAGFADDTLGLVARNPAGELVAAGGPTYADEGAVAGAAAGAGVGTLVGLGVLAGVIPVIGPAVVIGALGTILLNAVGGAAVVGLAGALIGWGIPEEDAASYEWAVKAGRFLVTVDAGRRGDAARAILDRHGAADQVPAAEATTAAKAGKPTARALVAAPTAAPKPGKTPSAKAAKRPAKKAAAKGPARRRK